MLDRLSKKGDIKVKKKYIVGSLLVILLLLAGGITAFADTANALYFNHSGSISATGGTIAEAIAVPDDGNSFEFFTVNQALVRIIIGVRPEFLYGLWIIF